jgi:hypothetical protein
MKKPSLALVLVCMVGCQMGNGIPDRPEAVQSSNRDLSHRQSKQECSTAFPSVHRSGGKIIFSDGNGGRGLPGIIRYAGVAGEIYSGTTFYTCDDNFFNTPVPQGYRADWWGAWGMCYAMCSISFGNGNRAGYIYSGNWVAGRTYYLYMFTLRSKDFIESYQVGPVDFKRSTLKIMSPFANGFLWPTSDSVALEIVHPMP